MNRLIRNSLLVATACVAFALMGGAHGFSADADWGTLKGKVLFDGEIPVLKPFVAKGDAKTKDAAVCAAQDIPDEALVVDPKSRGIANVVIYLKIKPAKIHPDLVASKLEEVKFVQTGCRFEPHILTVRTDQVVRVISDDEIDHNVHPMLSRNRLPMIVEPYDPAGKLVKELKLAERLPARIDCDIHPWMRAYWVILDHPYVAVTDEQGRFEISNLPMGNHEFTIWQESGGYLNKRYVVTIKEGLNDVESLMFTLDQFRK